MGLAFTAASCNSSSSTSIITTNQSAKVEALPFSTDAPRFFAVIEDHLLTVNCRYDTVLRVIDLKSGNTRAFGLRGKGPNEFLNIMDIYNDTENHVVHLADADHGKIFSLPHSSILQASTDGMTQTPMPMKRTLFTQMFPTKDGVAYTPLNGADLLTIQNNNGETFSLAHPDLLPYELHGEQKAYMYYSAMAHCAKRNKTVLALRYFPYFLIINHKGEVEKTVQTRAKYTDPRFAGNTINPTDETQIFYWQVVLSDSHIYLLDAGVTQRDYVNDVIKTSIEIYRWDGTPVERITPDYMFGNIVINPKTKDIYGISSKNMDRPIARLVLNKQLQGYIE